MSELAIDDKFKREMMERFKISEEEYETIKKAVKEPEQERGIQILAALIKLKKKRLEGGKK